MIDYAKDRTYSASFIGQGCEVECGVGKGLAIAARGGVGLEKRG